MLFGGPRGMAVRGCSFDQSMPPGLPMTLHALAGVRPLGVTCELCHHEAVLVAGGKPGSVVAFLTGRRQERLCKAFSFAPWSWGSGSGSPRRLSPASTLFRPKA